jgi:hypothetical protein
MGIEPDVSSIVPSRGCHVPARPLLGGVPSARFPRFLAPSARSDSSSPIPPRFVAFAWRYLPQFSGRRRRGLPSSSVTPMRTCPGSSTPAEPREQDLRDRQSLRVAPPVLPSGLTVSSASTTSIFRGPIPRPARSLSTLRGHGRPYASRRPRKTRFRLAVLPWPGGIPPAGSRNQVSDHVGSTWLPPGRGFSWRTVRNRSALRDQRAGYARSP